MLQKIIMDLMTNSTIIESESTKKPLQFHTRRNAIVQPLLTDLYQISMSYAYWKCKRHDDYSVFDLFFRRNPFGGEFAIFAGLEECLKFVQDFRFDEEDINYLRRVLPSYVENDFFEYLEKVNCDEVRLFGIAEGTVVFPRVPLIRIEGPLAIVQLLETALLNLVNFSSLVATNAARFRFAAGYDKQLLEFGLRRAQGPDGGLSASRYCYIGGFDATSNVLAGKLYGIPVKGTHAHSFVASFTSNEDIKNLPIMNRKTWKNSENFYDICLEKLKTVCQLLSIGEEQPHRGEFCAFISYAIAFPDSFLALIDTYDTLRSGLSNFIAVALALDELGYNAVGIRLDSGDLAYLSLEVRERLMKVSVATKNENIGKIRIVASNDINEETLNSLNQQDHSIDSYGIGTHLVTCQKQPALGCVFKLVEVNKEARIKLSQDLEKVTIPGKKEVYRLYSKNGDSILDLMQLANEEPPKPNVRILCRNPYVESKRAYVVPSKVERLYNLFWRGNAVEMRDPFGNQEEIISKLPSISEVRQHARNQLICLRDDIKRALNPTPYKISVSDCLYKYMHSLWLDNAPVGELS
ncbi:hypothetical protein SNEBB_009338 [Seison nebaliae]|nr:hypothetical protein SNEBB_009338 [Seison nebaliae]